jgi:CheY-like chemotaxis protein
LPVRGMTHDDGRGGHCNILVVDDNVDAADTLVSLLGLFGYEARAVYSGEQAVLVSEMFQPSLVFLDIDMPGIDGYETAALIRCVGGPSACKLVALTARNSAVDRTLSSSVGFDLHVKKPIGSRQLARLAELSR